LLLFWYLGPPRGGLFYVAFECNIFSFVFNDYHWVPASPRDMSATEQVRIVAIWVERNMPVIPVYEATIEEVRGAAGRMSSAWFDEPCSHAEPSGSVARR
jgi:hypothetical protein